MTKATGLKRIINALGYSCDGLKTAWKNEAAFRQEILACAILIPLTFFIPSTSVEKILMIGSLLLIVIVELINTGFENIIERISNDWHESSKKVKDLGSAAVLIAILNAVMIWGIILFNYSQTN